MGSSTTITASSVTAESVASQTAPAASCFFPATRKTASSVRFYSHPILGAGNNHFFLSFFLSFPACGNGVLDPGEECDSTTVDGCKNCTCAAGWAFRNSTSCIRRTPYSPSFFVCLRQLSQCVATGNSTRGRIVTRT